MMEAKNVTKHYPQGSRIVKALQGVSLRIEAGEFTSIMGPSGSGKSTLMHLLGALDTPTTGEVFFQIPAALEPPQLVPLKSKTIRNWLIATFHTNHGFFPRPSAIRQTIQSLEAQAADQPLRLVRQGDGNLALEG